MAKNRPTKKAPVAREWHLYSASAVTASLGFIVGVSTPTGSTPQTVGLIFVGVVATFLMTSSEWKHNVSITIHQWVIAVSILAVCIYLIIFGFLPKKETK